MIRTLTLFLIMAASPFVAADTKRVDDVVAALTSSDTAQRQAAVANIQALGRHDPLVRDVIAAIAADARYDEALFPVWQARRDPDPEMRPYVLALTRALNDPLADNRVTAARTLGDFFDPVAVPALIDALDDMHAETREWSARSLGDIGDAAAVPALLATLEDSNDDVCEWAARSLGDIGDASAVDGLIAQLDHNDADVREWLVRVLSVYAAPRSVPPLLARLGDSSATVRGWAARALQEMSVR